MREVQNEVIHVFQNKQEERKQLETLMTVTQSKKSQFEQKLDLTTQELDQKAKLKEVMV